MKKQLMKMKNLIAILVALVIIFALAACTNNAPAPSGGSGSATASSMPAGSSSAPATPAAPVTAAPVTVTLVNYNNEDAVKELLALVKEKLPNITLDYQFIDLNQYQNVVDTQLAAGEGADIIGSSPIIAEKHAKLGYIEDLSKYADLYSAMGTSVYTFDGKLAALPGLSWFQGIFYNKDLFAKYNLTVPKTFDELLATCKTLKAAGVKPMTMGAQAWDAPMKSSMMVVIPDYLFTDAGKNFDQNYKAGTQTLSGNWDPYIQKWYQLIEQGYLTKDMLGVSYDQSLEEFATGKAAMFESGPWSVATIKSKNPDLHFDMFPLYGNTSTTGYLIGGPGIGYELNVNSKVKDAAYQVLDLISSVEGQLAYAKTNEGSTSFLKGVDLPMPEEYASAMEAIKAGNIYCPWNVWGGNVGSVQEDYGKNMQEVIGGQETVEQALKAIDAKAAQLRSKG